MTRAVLTLLFLLVSSPTSNQETDTLPKNAAVNIFYTGNMGVFISNERTAVWIDGLHEYYGPGYLNPPDSILGKAFSKTAPFNNLKWLLFTHYHRDHFSKTLANRFLQSGPDHKIIGAPQVVDSFATGDAINAWDKNGDVIHDHFATLQIKAFNIPHTWPQRHSKVQNIAYLIEISGVSILHVGDADNDPGAFDSIGIDSLDVVIVPQWFDGEKSNSIIEKLNPKKIIFTHIAPGKRTGNNKTSERQELIFFESIGQSISM